MRGGIGVNVPAPEPDSGMMINVNMKSLNVDRWLALRQRDRRRAGSGSARRPRQRAPMARRGAAGMAQYVVPDTIGGRAGELIIGERKLDDVVVGVSHQNNSWQASIDSRQVTGYVTWNEAGQRPGPGQGDGAPGVARSFPSRPRPTRSRTCWSRARAPAASIPGLDIVAERFELFEQAVRPPGTGGQQCPGAGRARMAHRAACR